jgi:hypothetical protein
MSIVLGEFKEFFNHRESLKVKNSSKEEVTIGSRCRGLFPKFIGAYVEYHNAELQLTSIVYDLTEAFQLLLIDEHGKEIRVYPDDVCLIS